jgi:hypothetical protein
MKTFYEWLDKVNGANFTQYFGHNKGEGSETAHLVGKVIKVLQHHTQNLNTILSHHNEILGAKADPYAGHRQWGKLNNINGAVGSESEAIRQVGSGYKLLGKLLPTLEQTLPTEKDRDMRLFAKELVETIKEGEQLSIYLTKGMNEENFGMLTSNFQKLIRLVREGSKFMSEQNPGFHQTFSAQQQHDDIGSQKWRKKDAVDLTK